MNEEVEETYLVDEKPEKGKTALPVFLPSITPVPGQTYRERRKSKKHVIVYHAQREYPLYMICYSEC